MSSELSPDNLKFRLSEKNFINPGKYRLLLKKTLIPKLSIVLIDQLIYCLSFE